MPAVTVGAVVVVVMVAVEVIGENPGVLMVGEDVVVAASTVTAALAVNAGQCEGPVVVMVAIAALAASPQPLPSRESCIRRKGSDYGSGGGGWWG